MPCAMPRSGDEIAPFPLLLAPTAAEQGSTLRGRHLE